MRFLCFRLFAPLASFGDVAVGERRPSLNAPTRSMVLGLLGACLGIPREDADGHSSLERAVGVATRTDANGSLLVDYHTAQAPDEPRIKAWRKSRGVPPATRRDELMCTFDGKGEPSSLGTQLSWREYRTDAAFVVGVWLRDEAPWSLEVMAAALRRPRFVPFAGRKAAAFALPFEPSIAEAEHPVTALRGVSFTLDEVLEPVTKGATEQVFRWEGEWSGVTPSRTETRRDRVASRARWQFRPREEHVWTNRIERGEAAHVSEQDRAEG